MKKPFSYIIISIFVLLAASLGWLYFADYLEREKPSIQPKETITAIGKKRDILISFSDRKSGLAHVSVEIIQNDRTHPLAAETFSARGVNLKDLAITIDTDALKLNNGPAVIRLAASDHSLFKNQTVSDIDVRIDTVPPYIYLLNTVNYVNPGGTCFIAYRTSKPTLRTGVYVNDDFTPGRNIMLKNKPTSVVFFAVPLDALRGKTTMAVFARDDAGNETRLHLPNHIRDKKFRADKVNLSDSFLHQKMPEFQLAFAGLRDKSPEDVFAYINSTLRKDNDQTIHETSLKSANQQLWDGAFLRMRNASTMAMFGDKRTFLVGGKSVGTSIHLGVDLASSARAPIEAANSGIVVFAGELGIYGNTVIIDHGLGLMSLYAHLSAIDASVGKTVAKSDKIGYSGTTGLAGGDHLHFSILAGGRFVNPVEWWDASWIHNNIVSKMSF
jgi:murein DD-endopeptidase MepM/ murein hydrolase activator NlpD